MSVSGTHGLDAASRQFYQKAMITMTEAGIRFLVGGAYAFQRHTGIARHTKDFDVFLTRQDTEQAIAVLEVAGYRTEMTFPHWLAKAHSGEYYVDLIFGSGNGLASVDQAWFDHALDGESMGIPVRFCPVEEMIWSKAFIMERERFDGADIAHLLFARATELDWNRLLARFEPHPRLLLTHLILFGFIYPDRRGDIPGWAMKKLLDALQEELAQEPPTEKVCYGTILSRGQYLTDIGQHGYFDARLLPPGTMSGEDVAFWTSMIGEE